MREIKFRGKRKDNGGWVEGDLIHSGKDTSIVKCDTFTVESSFRVIPESVGQYIGFNDKDDKEIYSGDVFGCNYCEKDLFEIYHDDENARFNRRLIKGKGCGNIHCMYVTDFARSKILGNTTDNPELLEETKK